MSDLLRHITFDSGREPRYSMIWLHGLGASGDDFVPVAEALQLPHAVRHIFPHAPQMPVTLNGGFVMPAWYDIYNADATSWNRTDNATMQDGVGIRASQQAIDAFIEHEIARGIPPANIFLAGFSQGGAIALQCGLRRQAGLGGILALSTYLPLADTLQTEACQAGLETPLFMAHGRQDTVVPYALGTHSLKLLQEAGSKVDWHEYDMPHSVCMEEIDDISGWLSQRMTSAD
ncbi:MAG: carboxylesterase [Gammaproteobacteria bacterium]|nr:carboxylesterase [Gammaproteobacteria bacterium]MBU1623443.1 carboxylesterase [Gammaproteobacteria bacterium]MBU1982282.1 carboxylesterase [Gammaproteobacteria bacterium]